MSKKLIVALLCLIMAFISLALGNRNRTLKDAEEILISKMLESRGAIEVFGLEDYIDGGVFT